jgi:hypothetical protein
MSQNPNRRTEVRKPAAVLLGVLVALVCFGAVVAGARTGTIPPIKVWASVSPKHRVIPPPKYYTFYTSGHITFPTIYCPPGTTNPAYCTAVTAKEACTGKVSLYVHLGRDPILADAKTTVQRTTTKVTKKCTYFFKSKFPNSDFTATHAYVPHERGSYVFVGFHVKFLGNSVLAAKTARVQYVVAKLINP